MATPTGTKPRAGASARPAAAPAAAPKTPAPLPARYTPFEQIEGLALTLNEQQKLSRLHILKWFNSKKRKKLKGLQDQLISATTEERDTLREVIIKNTMEELKKQKHLSIEDRRAKAEKFANEILGVSDGIGNVEEIAKKHERTRLDEKLFTTILDDAVGKAKDREMLGKLKKDPYFGKIVRMITKVSPAAGARIDLAMKEGDYDEMRKAIVEGAQSAGLPKSLSKGDVDNMMGAVIFRKPGVEKITGIDTIDKLIGWANSLRNIGHGFALKKAAKALGMNYLRAARLGRKTFTGLTKENEILQRNRYLLENKTTKTTNDNLRLVYIDQISKTVQKVESDSREMNLPQKFQLALGKHLSSNKKLSDMDKQMILQEAKWQDMRMLDIFEFVYAPPEKRERAIEMGLAHAPRMWRYAKKFLGAESSAIKKTMKAYHARRLADWSKGSFLKNAKKWGLGKILKDVNAVDKRLARNSGALGALHGDVEAFAGKQEARNARGRSSSMANEMLEHDDIVKNYQSLVQQTTKIMSAQAKELISAGRAVQKAQQNAGKDFLTSPVSKLSNLNDDTLKALFPNGKPPNMKGGDLLYAYQKRMVELRTMQDVARTRFSVLAENIDKNVATPFETRWTRTKDIATRGVEKKQIKDQLDRIETKIAPASRPKYLAKKFGIPAIIIGVHAHSLFTGKAKTNEVVWDLAEAGMGFVPFVGTALDIRNLAYGTSLSGKKLSGKEMAMTGVFAAVGIVADVATLFGGAGLALRGALGGVRGARRTVRAASAAGNLSDMAHAQKLPWAQSIIAKGAGVFNKAKRADKAVEATYASKAMEQARLMGKCKISDMSDLEKELTAAKALGDTNKVRDLQRLKKMYVANGGVDYHKVWNTYKKGADAIDIPQGFFQRGWMGTLTGFKKMKAFFLRIGIPADTVKAYEKSFNAVESAKFSRTKALDGLKIFQEGKRVSMAKKQEAYRELYAQGSTLGKTQKDYAKTAGKVRELTKKRTAALDEYNSLKKKHEEAVKAFKAGDLKRVDVDNAKNLMERAKGPYDNVAKEYSQTLAKKKDLSKNIGGKNARWKKQFDGADRDLAKLEHGLARREGDVRRANNAISNANSSRAQLQFEMENRATRWARRSQQMRGAARALQMGGLAMGAAWFFSGFKYGPAEQYQAATKVVKTGGGTAIKAAKYVYWDDHSGTPAIDVLIQKRIASLSLKKHIDKLKNKAFDRGVDPAKFYAKHWNTPEAREMAKKEGLMQRVQDLIARGKARVQDAVISAPRPAAAGARGRASTIDIASGDSARTVRE